MKEKKLKKLVRSLVVKFHKKGKTTDEAKVAMIGKGVPWGRCNSLYKEAAVKEGIIQDPIRVTSDINKKVAKVDFDDLTQWHQVEAVVEKIVGKVKGADTPQVLRTLRKHAKDMDVALPKKSRAKGAGRVSAIPAAIVDLVNENKDATKQDCYNTIVPLAKGDNPEATSLRYCNSLFPTASAIANGESLPVTMAKLAGQKVDTDLEEDDSFNDSEDEAYEANEDESE